MAGAWWSWPPRIPFASIFPSPRGPRPLLPLASFALLLLTFGLDLPPLLLLSPLLLLPPSRGGFPLKSGSPMGRSITEVAALAAGKADVADARALFWS